MLLYRDYLGMIFPYSLLRTGKIRVSEALASSAVDRECALNPPRLCGSLLLVEIEWAHPSPPQLPVFTINL